MYCWNSTFKSQDGETYLVSIEDSTLEADRDFSLGARAVEIQIERGKHKYAPLKSRSATIHVADSADMSTIYSELWDRKVLVSRTSDSARIFDGWVVPAQWTQDVRLGVNEYTIEAQDSIGKLGHVKYTMANAASGRQVVTYAQVLIRAATLIGLNGGAPLEWSNISISEDAFLPDDWTKDNSDDDWMTWGEILEAMCLSTGTAVMIDGGYLQVYDLDSISTTWVTDAEEHAQDTTMTMEVEPAISRVECKPTLGKKVWLNDPLSDDRVWFGWKGQDPKNLIMSYVTDDGKRCFYYPASGHKDITNYDDVVTRYYIEDNDGTVSHDIGQGAKASNVIHGLVGFDTPTWDVRALHANPFTDIMNLYVKMSMFCNVQDQSTSYPREWLESEGDELQSSALQLRVGNTVLQPNTMKTEWESAHKGFFDVEYQFNYVPQGQIVLEWKSNTEKWFVKGIDVYFYDPAATSEFSERLVHVLTNSFDNQLSVDQPFVAGGRSWGGYKGAAMYIVSGSYPYENALLNKLAAQYAVCRRRFRVTLPVTGFALNKLVTFRGYTCTIDAAEMNLKRGVVTVTLLEMEPTVTE
jgi:hypothetical protein